MRAQRNVFAIAVAVGLGIAAGPAYAPPVVLKPAPVVVDPEALGELFRDGSGQYFAIFRERRVKWQDRGRGKVWRGRLTAGERERFMRRRAAVREWSERRDERYALYISPNRHAYELAWFPKTSGRDGERVGVGKSIHLEFTNCRDAWALDCNGKEPPESAPRVVRRMLDLMRSLRTKVVMRSEQSQNRPARAEGATR